MTETVSSPEATEWIKPAHATADLVALNTMLTRLRELPAQGLPAAPRPLILNLKEADGCLHRIVVSRFEPLLQPGELTFVGFFGLKSPTADGEALTRVDTELIDEFPQNPGLCTYSSLELKPGGQWGNLVLFARTNAIDHWKEGVRHKKAVDELAPKSYTAIRLHNGKLLGGLDRSSRLELTATKYYDYTRRPA
jgi:hypothetical protein